ncbi:MAG: hypothetical protein P4L55_12685 [Syntrophobacteraceae bacterium]|nr:hypothetical protein [Syntrophobacteraceae bacterium]
MPVYESACWTGPSALQDGTCSADRCGGHTTAIIMETLLPSARAMLARSQRTSGLSGYFNNRRTDIESALFRSV